MPNKFICPLCKDVLLRASNSLKCSSGHCFDISSSGYVNLLTKSVKKGHGDDKKMVAARRDFLSKGYYSHLKEGLKDIVENTIKQDEVMLDSGCGEGYYTQGFIDAVKNKRNAEIYGIDVSKEALKLAAKLYPKAHFAVSSAYCLPFKNESLDIIASVFAPMAVSEFQRTLKQNGYFINTIPLENHLYGLKKAVYKNPYLNAPKNTELDGFELTESVEIKKELTITGKEDIKNLFMMTPYYYKTSADDQAKLETLDSLVTETEFLILVYRKK